MDIKHLKDYFLKTYGSPGPEIRTFFAPGRINLIGEHTDYNGGYVLPFAINTGTYLLIRQNNTDTIRLKSLNFEYSASLEIAELGGKKISDWINYPIGVLNEFLNRELCISGLDLMYIGTIPNGAGLSSSASIEMVTAYAVNSLFGFEIEVPEMAKMCRHAENTFVGMNCGIMDQFAVGLCKRNNALFVDCNTDEFSLVPFHPDNHQIVIVNTNKRRELTGSKYNERVAECREAVKEITAVRPIENLSRISYQEFNEINHLIKDETIRKRALHVVSENRRVLEAVGHLKQNDYLNLGQKMIDSHASLKDNYEVTGYELDTMVEEALKIPGVTGSRMTGAGFGGCTVNLVEKSAVEYFVARLGKIYLEKTNLKADFYIASASDGVREI
jgi:galactokinase